MPPNRSLSVRRRAHALAALSLLVAGCGGSPDAIAPQTVGPGGVAATAVRLAGAITDSMTPLVIGSGDTLRQPITLQMLDAAGQAAPVGGLVVRLSLTTTAGLPMPGARLLTPDTATTSSLGIATFAMLAVGGTSGSGQLAFTAGALSARAALKLTAGRLASTVSAFTLLPDTTPVGGTSQVTVLPLDASGNRLGAGHTVTVALTGGTSAISSPTFAFSATDSSYRATLTGVTSGTASTVTAIVDGQPLAAALRLTIIPNVVPPVAASRLAMAALPGDTTGGFVTPSGALLPPLMIALRDAAGQPVRQLGVAITPALVSTTGGTVPSMILAGSASVSTDTSGQALFPALRLTGAPGSARIEFRATSLTSTSLPVRVGVGAVSSALSTVIVPGDSVALGSTLLARVIPRDAAGTPLGGAQTVAASFTGGTSVLGVGAPAYAPADSSYGFVLTATAVGTSRTLAATVNGVALSTTRPVRVTAGVLSPSVSTVTAGVDSIAIGAASVITITPRDAAGNKLGAGRAVTVAMSGGTSAGTLGAVTFNATDSTYRSSLTGTVSGTALSISAQVGGVPLTPTATVRVTVPGVSPGVSTLTVSSDSIGVGATSVISVIPRDASGAKRGAGLTVAVLSSGGTSAGSMSAVTYSASDSSYRSTFTATASGTPRIIGATVGGVPLTATRTITVVSAVAQSWTFCLSADGGYCEFRGLRTVRLFGSDSSFVTQTAFQVLGCNKYSFLAQLPANSQELRCDYGPLKTEVVTNPSPGMAGLTAASVTVPLGDPGRSTLLIAPSTSTPTPTPFDGSFRMVCNLTRMAGFDPIVYPGQTLAGHLHMFFGNTDITPSSTTQSLASSGNSTCMGGIMNRTGYWVPVVFDAVSGEVQFPQQGVFYYKTGYNLDPTRTMPIPAGLRMIAGDKSATGTQDVGPNYAVGWNCMLAYNQQASVDGFIPNCAVGDAVVLMVNFPECWDGVNLDSPDHKSHMSYATYRNQPQVSSCPPTHPVQLPRISEIFRFPVTANSRPLNWRMTSDTYSTATRGGLSAHADWMDGWSRDGMTTLVRYCLNAMKDCGVGTLGDGRDLVYPRQ